jgi:hypothetical protein
MLNIRLSIVVLALMQVIWCQETPKPTSVPKPGGNYRSGKLSFEADRTSNSANFSSVDSPLLLLSISHI